MSARFELGVRDHKSMIKPCLKDYVRCYDHVLSEQECSQVLGDLSTATWREHRFYDSQHNQNVDFGQELDISWHDSLGRQLIHQRIWSVINQYITQDLADFQPWFGGWSGYSPPRFNRYCTGTRMHLHCDHIVDLFEGVRRGIPILSLVGALNSDYTGGEFVMWQDHVIDIAPGSVLVFPSIFLYPHQVKPVVSGTRYTYVSWVW